MDEFWFNTSGELGDNNAALAFAVHFSQQPSFTARAIDCKTIFHYPMEISGSSRLTETGFRPVNFEEPEKCL